MLSTDYFKIRTDIDPENTWVVSDTHFGHENIKAFCHRPLDVERIMMEEWARAVPAEGTVLHLGDLSYRNNSFFKNIIAPRLTGERKLLILGNHDKQRFSFYRDSGFKLIKPIQFEFEGWLITADHYPFSRPPEGKRLHLHGHIHNNGYGGKGGPFIPFMGHQINLSAEMTKYRPVNLKILLDGFINGYVNPDDPRAKEI